MKMKNIIALSFIFLVRLYQIFVSPFLPNKCRFYPTCSQYALEALKKHTFFKAFTLIIKRIFSCHPFGKRGYDPVP